MSKNINPTKKQFVNAILSTSPERLQYLIDQGYKINLPIFQEDRSTCSFDQNKSDRPIGEIVALSRSPGASSMIYPIHLAVATLYSEAAKGYSNSYGINRALDTITILLDNGAKWWQGCCDVLIYCGVRWDWVLFSENYPENQAIHLALLLKKYEQCGSNKFMDKAIKLLQEASEEVKSPSLKTAAILESVAYTYKSMLFSEDFSDVVFQCSDGVSVPAHKFILAASSPYFKTAFQGDWAENNSEGIWRTSHSSSLIKSVLTLIYTGSVEECEKLLQEKGNDPLGLLDIAFEYDIAPLMFISVDNCIKKLNIDNVRMMLQTAHVHSCKKLKKACFEYIKTNATKALMSLDMIRLATEEPGLWDEFGAFLYEPPTKRPRTNEK